MGRHGVYSSNVEDGLPSTLPTARWLEITLLPSHQTDVLEDMYRQSHLYLHPELRVQMPTFPDLVGLSGDAEKLATRPASMEGAPIRERIDSVAARLAMAQRFGVKGASKVAEALGWQPAGRRFGTSEMRQGDQDTFKI